MTINLSIFKCSEEVIMLEIDNFKENVLTWLPLRRDEEILAYQKKIRLSDCIGVPFIRIANETYELYRQILLSLNTCLEQQYLHLVYAILQKEQEKAESVRKIEDLSNTNNYCFEFYDTRNKHKVYAILKSHPPKASIELKAYTYLKVEDGGELCLVLTNSFGYAVTHVAERRIKTATGLTNVTIMDLPEFLLRFYGKEAKRCFEKAVKQLNEKLDGVIGYSIAEICSEKALDKLKKQLKDEWQHYNFDTFFADSNINIEKQQKLIDKFLAGKKYLYLFNDETYSDSYITSEWFYQKYAGTIKAVKLDMTAVVAGYFKSVE